MTKSALIIGSGIAGLAVALRLRKKGYAVTVYEANDHVGGKMHLVREKAYRWDSGPSLFTMPHLVDELFELFNHEPQNYYSYLKMDKICNYFWEDGTRFSAAADKAQFVADASATFDVSEESILKYLQKSQKKYDLTANIFLEKSLHKIKTYLSLATLKSLMKSYQLDINTSLDAVNNKSFDNQQLVQLFNRYATYNGSSPYKTPGIMSMIPHLEMHYGTFFPEGGMVQIVQSLHRLAEEQGVEFKLKEPVMEINYEGDLATGIKTSKADVDTDLIVSNMDIFSTYKSLLNELPHPERILSQERSSSALIFYWGVKGSFPELDLHNIFFSDNYEGEFKALFDEKKFSDDPTIYINISSKQNPKDAPDGCENWFVMVNAPGDYGQDWEVLKAQVKSKIVKKINRILNIDLNPLIEVEQILDPISIENKTKSHKGSLYGTSSNSKFSAFLRHPNFSKQLKNLYFCGGSVHPGGGIPLCLSSAKIVSDLIPDLRHDSILNN